jgi:DNA polymerase sigma
MMANFLKANNSDSKLTDQILTLLGQFQTSTSAATNQSPPQLPRQQSQIEQQPLPLSSVEKQFHNMVSVQIKAQIKYFEMKLDSVRKEREHTILMIDRTIRKLFSGSSVKQYGSQANLLALDSSDVDLAVTGLNFGQSQAQQMNQMNKLFTHIEKMSILKQAYFVNTATVPVIKLQADLQYV